MNKIDLIERNLQRVLRILEKADTKTIQVAIEVIRSYGTPSSPASSAISESIQTTPPINTLIQFIFQSMHGIPLTWVQDQGYESLQELIEKKLEHCLWNHIEVSSSLDPTYDGLASLILAKPIPKKIPVIPIASDKAEDLLQEQLTEEKRGHSLEGEFAYFCDKVEKRFASLIEQTEDETRKQELSYMEGEFRKLKDRIQTYPKAKLFSENEEERKKQYYEFGALLGVAFTGLLEQKNEDLFFLHIKDFLEECFKGWDEYSRELIALGSKETVYLNPEIEAWKIACLVRRKLVEKALKQAFPGFEEDVHYHSAAKRAMNHPFHLGFSKEELGVSEPDIVALVNARVKQKLKELLVRVGKDELIRQLISRYKEMDSEEDQKTVFVEVLSQYTEKVKEDPSFLIDPLEEVQVAWKAFQDSATLAHLQSLRKTLQEKAIVSFSIKLSYEKKLEEIREKYPLFFIKFPTHAGMREKSKQMVEYCKSYPSEIKNPPQEVIESLEDLISEERIIQDLQEVQRAADRDSFLNVRALYNRDLLEKKLNDEEKFGAYAWAIQSKVLRLDDARKEDLNVRILEWIGTLAFSSNQKEKIFEVLSRYARKLEDEETNDALQACRATGDLEALIASQSKPETFSSLEDLLCFGTAEDLRLRKVEIPIPNEDLKEALKIVITRGELPLVQEVLRDQELSLEVRWPAILLSVRRGRLNILQELLQQGAIPVWMRAIAVAKARLNNHAHIANFLLKGITISESDLGIAVQIEANNGHLDVIRELLKQGAIPVWMRAIAAAEARINKHDPIAEELLKDITILESDRGIAIQVEANNNHLDVIQELLKGGTIPVWMTALIAAEARINKHDPIAEELLKGVTITEMDLGTAIRWAAHNGLLDVIQELLKGRAIPVWMRVISAAEARINKHDPVSNFLLEGITISNMDVGIAIQVEASNGNSDVIQELLKGRFIPVWQRAVAATEARINKHDPIAEELLKGVTITEMDRGTAVQWAAHNDRLDVIQGLLKEGTISGSMRVIAAAEARINQYDPIAAFLLEDITISEKDQVRAVELAERNNRLDLIKEFKNINIPGHIRATLIAKARNKQNHPIAEELLNGGTISKEDVEKALQIARQKSREDVALELSNILVSFN
jgi:ankyrin repeat protein